MVEFTFPSLNADQGTATSSGLRNAANAAANHLCGLYRDYPSGLVPSLGDPSGVGRFTDGLLSDLCRDRGSVPPPPLPPFQGGQCYDLYRDEGTWQQGSLSGSFNGGQRFGKRSNPRIVADPPGTTQGTIFVDVQESPGSPVVQTRLQNVGFGGQGSVPTFVYSPVFLGSGGDSCGNPSPAYPPALPPPGAYSTDVPVGVSGVPIVIPVTVIPTVFAPRLQFRPEFNIDVGGINVNFNLGGVTLSLGGSRDTSITLPKFDPRPLPPPPTSPRDPTTVASNPDLSGITDLLDDIKECACEDPKIVTSTSFPSSVGRQSSLPSGAFLVKLSIIPNPNVKLQVGAQTAPDVLYLGWIAFGVDGNFGERLNISFRLSAFPIPQGSTEFAYSLNYQSVGTATVFSRVNP